MIPQEIAITEMDNYARLQRIKRANGQQDNAVLDYELRLSAEKLASLGVDADNLRF